VLIGARAEGRPPGAGFVSRPRRAVPGKPALALIHGKHNQRLAPISGCDLLPQRLCGLSHLTVHGLLRESVISVQGALAQGGEPCTQAPEGLFCIPLGNRGARERPQGGCGCGRASLRTVNHTPAQPAGDVDGRVRAVHGREGRADQELERIDAPPRLLHLLRGSATRGQPHHHALREGKEKIDNMSGKSRTVYGWDESEYGLYILFYNLYSDVGRSHP
jgi:hypothetical protein